MKIKKIRSILLSGCLVLTAAAIAFSAVTLSWFSAPGDSTEKALNGEVGLRGYFFAGDGATENTAFEIVSPIHLLNLSRLQSIGIFPKKTYFRLGHIFEENQPPKFINIVDGNPVYSTTLDMDGVTIRPIGSEATPFYGTFDGRGLTIANLTVEGTPEDIGLFGYIGVRGAIKYRHPITGQLIREPTITGEVKNLICQDINIKSVGYTNEEGDLKELFSQLTYAEDLTYNPEDIDEFITSGALASDTTLEFYEYNTTTGNYDRNNLTKWNGNSSTAGMFTHINATSETESLSKIVLDGDEKIHKGYFKVNFPTASYPQFNFSWLSSNELITASDIFNLDFDGDEVADDNIPVINLTKLLESEEFNNKDANFEVDTRLYLVASLAIGEYTYSKVIQSYTVKFVSNFSTANQGNYNMYIFCDYKKTNRPDDINNTGYHHGNNIGFIAGHVDGIVKDCFIYRGSFDLNVDSSDPLSPLYHNNTIFSESATGLVGEINTNVANDIDPEVNASGKTIGVMNLTGIYDLIRSDVSQGDTVAMAGTVAGLYYMGIDNQLKEDTSDRFVEYLRKTTNAVGSTKYIIKTDSITGVGSEWDEPFTLQNTSNSFNKVDFANNFVIEDEEDVNRELGVFKIVTQAAPENASVFSSEYFNKCIIQKGDPKNKVYFSTAEYDHQKENEMRDSSIPYTPFASWNPFRATSTPKWSDLNTFSYPWSREYNYVFRLDLSEKEILDTNYYMWNTSNDYLVHYLQSKLVDDGGNPVTPETPTFGFSFRTAGNGLVDNLSSYMPLRKPGAKAQYGTFAEDSSYGEWEAGDPRYLPSNSIVFDIENEHGANVSVVAADADVTIYSYDPTTPSGDLTPLYTMRAKCGEELDSNRYFKYSGVTGGPTDEEVQPAENDDDMNNGKGALYAHIFKLDGGEGKHYVIGANGTDEAKLYYLSVQGQTQGTLGGTTKIGIGDSTVKNVEFVLSNPAYSDTFPSNLSTEIAKLSYEAKFNNAYHNKNIAVNVITVDATKHLNIVYNNNEEFITFLMTYVRPEYPEYYINSVLGHPRNDGTQIIIGSRS